jgi:hypothetical protein
MENDENFAVEHVGEDQHYVGTKRIIGRPMNRQAYNDYRGWTLPEDENGSDEGYLVEYLDGGQSNHADHAGYISWSPKAVFEKSYRPVKSLTFGDAIEWMRKGQRVTRLGWNGKDMFIYIVPAASYPAQRGAAKAWAGEDAMIPYGPYIAMKTVDGTVVPWLASQTDVLGEDWTLYPG